VLGVDVIDALYPSPGQNKLIKRFIVTSHWKTKPSFAGIYFLSAYPSIKTHAPVSLLHYLEVLLLSTWPIGKDLLLSTWPIGKDLFLSTWPIGKDLLLSTSPIGEDLLMLAPTHSWGWNFVIYVFFIWPKEKDH
jgi:hypothetical protein